MIINDDTPHYTSNSSTAKGNVKLIKYLKPYWLLAILSPMFMIAEVTLDLFQPKLMSQIVDKGVITGNINFIIKTGFIMLLLVLCSGVTGLGAAAFASAASQGYGNDLRSVVFRRVMSLSLEQTDKFTTGSLITRLTNDVTAVQELVAMSLRIFVRAPMQFIGGIIMALSFNINFGLVLICALPVQLIILWLVLYKAGPLYSVVQNKLDKVNSVVQENVSGSRIIKAYVREDYENNRFNIANTELMTSTLRVQKLMIILNPVLMIIMNLSVIAIIYIGGLQVEAGAIGIGQVMAAVTYVTQILMSMMMVSMMFQSVTRSRASAERIREVLSTIPIINSGKKIIECCLAGSIIFKDVCFNYPEFSGQPVLQGINLEINPGETFALLGATGSGKTTLVNLIPRFYDTTAGSVTVNGIDVREYDLENLRTKIGFVLQKNELFSGSIMDNIRWGKGDATDEEIFEAARIAQADEFIRSFKEGYNTIIGEKGASLSGGQRQRIAIARALLRKPEILIFDDSTSALDLGTESRLQKALRENLKETTVIIIAQRIASIINADRIAVLDNSHISACGKHSELIETSDLYRDIYNSQARNGVAEIG